METKGNLVSHPHKAKSLQIYTYRHAYAAAVRPERLSGDDIKLV